jgi:hypothetical protein
METFDRMLRTEKYVIDEREPSYHAGDGLPTLNP